MQTALITGASRGLGHALATHLAANGWNVIAAGRDEARLAATRAAHPAAITTAAGDLRDHAHQIVLAELAREAGGLDLLVLNAGTLGPSPLPPVRELDPAALHRLLSINVVAQVSLTQLLLPQLLARPLPTIVSLSSDAASGAYPGWGGYGASKAALDQLMAVLAAELPALTVYAFDPGDMRTDMHQRAFPGEDISDRPEPAAVVPALLDLLRRRPDSGRYQASDLLAEAGVHA